MGGEAVEGGGDEGGDFGVVVAEVREVFARGGDDGGEQDQASKLDSIARQREARGSSGGASDGEPGEAGGGEGKVAAVSVVGAWNLVSWGSVRYLICVSHALLG